MKTHSTIPDSIWRWIKPLNRFVTRIYGGKFKGSRLVLLLTTTGRKTGTPRVTPLQYEEIDGDLYIGSARGDKADWFQNILADPSVEVQIEERRFEALAEPVTDIERITDFLELRIQRRPRMIPTIMRFEGLPKNHSRADLEAFAAGKAMVILRPLEAEANHES